VDLRLATDEVVDLIASIELQRQVKEDNAGRASACDEALRRLQELLEREQEALRLHGSGSEHAANIEAVTSEIGKVKRLAGGTSRPSLPNRPYPRQHEVSWRDTPRNPARNRGRRTMGRSSGR